MSSSRSVIADRRLSPIGGTSGKLTRALLSIPKSSRPVRTQKLPVLPGEDARAYRGRMKAWVESLVPRNPMEQYLVERAVTLSWQLDRADRAQKARLIHAAGRARPGRTPEDAAARAAFLAFDDSESGERLRRYQVACGRALLLTLRAISDSRQDGKTGAAAGESAPSVGAEALAGLIDALRLAAPAAPTGAPTVGDAEAPAAADAGTGSSPRRSRTIPRRPRPDWSERAGSRLPTTSDADARRRPVQHSLAEPQASPEPQPRRRVGGYAVPMDVSAPISCADRIPVRLRRQARAASASS